MRIIGHRGARFEAPENTVSGFRYALGLGLDAFELDIHLTSDEELAVIHDATVDRTTNGSGAVAEMTLSQLQALDARSNFPDWPEPCSIPTYAQVLDVLRDVAWLETEIKTDAPERLDIIVPRVVDEVRRFGMEQQVIIMSFDPYALELAKTVAPQIRRGYVGRWDSIEDLDIAKRLEVSLVGIPYATGQVELVRQAQSLGMIATGWPTNTADALDAAFALGVDCICTDAPTTMRSLLAERTGEVRI